VCAKEQSSSSEIAATVTAAIALPIVGMAAGTALPVVGVAAATALPSASVAATSAATITASPRPALRAPGAGLRAGIVAAIALRSDSSRAGPRAAGSDPLIPATGAASGIDGGHGVLDPPG